MKSIWELYEKSLTSLAFSFFLHCNPDLKNYTYSCLKIKLRNFTNKSCAELVYDWESKNKVVLMIKHCSRKVYGGVEIKALHIFHLSTEWYAAVSFMRQILYHQGKCTKHPWTWGGLDPRIGLDGDETPWLVVRKRTIPTDDDED
jgi:hypothetical protein